MRISTLSLSASLFCLTLSTQAAPLQTAPVQISRAGPGMAVDGVVEAVRGSTLSVQVAGKVTRLKVQPGDKVKAGQLLARVDALAADQLASASGAQAEGARASLELARKDYIRQQQLFEQRYISQAALDRAHTQFRAAQAQANAQLAQAAAARSQSGFYQLTAPYAGVVSEVPVSLGELAMAGKTLLKLYDPNKLRVSLAVPQSQLALVAPDSAIQIELPSLPGAQRWVSAQHMQILPGVDPISHTVTVRVDLPADRRLAPGTFARAWLKPQAQVGERLWVPSQALFKRAEISAVYVVNGSGQALLRQVKVGRPVGAQTEILAGLNHAEQVALDPLAAARLN